MKRMNPWQTVRGRLLFLAVGFEAIMLTVLITNSIRLLHSAMSSQVQTQAQQFSPVLIAALTAPLIARDYATMQAVVDESRTKGGLDYIVVVDRYGHRLASNGWPADMPLQESSKELSLFESKIDPRYDVIVPIEFQQQSLGKLHFGVDLSQIVHARQVLLIQGVGIAAIEILLSSVILLFLGFWLTRHMKSLTQASLEVASGNLSPPLVPEGDDDVGKLGAAFNIMSRVIKERVNELTIAKEIAEASEAQLRGITHSANDAILMMDHQGAISFWNPAAEQILGYRSEEVLGCNLHNLLAPERYLVDHTSVFPEFQRTGCGHAVGKTLEIFARKKDGMEIPVALSMSAVMLNGKWHSMGIMRDISEIKHAQEQLTLKQKQLESLNRSLHNRVQETVTELRHKDQILISQGRQAAMGEMIGNIAHQWRQPLNVLALLIADIQCTQQENELTDEYMNESAATANLLIQKMSSTINDFRNFFCPDKEIVAFSAMVQIKLAINMVEAAFKNNSISISVEADSDCTLQGFPNEYSQVLLNLLNNAKDAIVDTETTKGQIIITLKEQDDMGVVTVRDNGGGIPEAILNKIFEPYFSTKNLGTGIGLYMSKMIIERNMNGHITAKSIEGGSELSVSTPLGKNLPG